ncbi:hypothetical protein NDR87_35135 [Nocardia sp. CDC159]|uniref:Uncharacterized protein n=1 Tax=Nocardia pulmonis TaxID=2951408 RepID=A0A9X2ED74_9NOCA|nr:MULTISPECIES: hypothetical protein [Nocardia]MCM6778724.1 hypothetical protein [Nocardia pulmonis]MCM6791613.1 hypothetical protein [Nocardia sp. CDC159]
MTDGQVHVIPIGAAVRGDIEVRGKGPSCRARVRWSDPVTKKRSSKSQTFDTPEEAQEWIDKIHQAAARGVEVAENPLRPRSERVFPCRADRI